MTLCSGCMKADGSVGIAILVSCDKGCCNSILIAERFIAFFGI